MWKRGEISPLFHNILLLVLRFPCKKRDQNFASIKAVIHDKWSRDNEGPLYKFESLPASLNYKLLYLPSIFGQAGLSKSLDPAQTALKELFDWVSIVSVIAGLDTLPGVIGPGVDSEGIQRGFMGFIRNPL